MEQYQSNHGTAGNREDGGLVNNAVRLVHTCGLFPLREAGGFVNSAVNHDSMYMQVLLPFQAWYEPFPALVRNFQWWLNHKLSPTARLISVQSLPVKIKTGGVHFLSSHYVSK